MKNRLVAKANKTIAKANLLKLSAFSEPFHRNPSISLEEPSNPRWVRSSFLSIPTRRLSNTIIGSEIRAKAKMNATTLKALQKYNE